jgi:hypothetical protein
MPKYDWDTFLRNVHVIWTGFTCFPSKDLRGARRKPGPDNLEAVTSPATRTASVQCLDLLNSVAHGNACRVKSVHSSRRWTYW